MSLEMQRERVKLLRTSAAALIDETISEPCWGLAQSLLEMAEGLVRESGHPAERFGSGGGTVYGPEEVEFMPECCAACGEWGGQHVGWCIHVEAQAAEGEPAEDAAASELLAWLDLSGLPPAPLEPPAHRRQNWRFDGPDSGEQIPF